MHKLSENHKVIKLIDAQDIASATTTNGTGVDCVEMDNDLVAILQIGSMVGTHTCDVKIQESDTLGSGYVDITGAVFTQANESSDLKIAAIGFKRTLRYVRAVVVTAGTVTTNIISVCGLVKAMIAKSTLNSATLA